MSRPALLANENVPVLMVAELRRAGVEVESVAETMPAAGDPGSWAGWDALAWANAAATTLLAATAAWLWRKPQT